MTTTQDTRNRLARIKTAEIGVNLRVGMKHILVYFPKGLIEQLDSLVPQFYPNRNEAIRMAVQDLVKREVRQ